MLTTEAPVETAERTAPTIGDVLADLNSAQYAAATHGDAPLLIVAGAGTGKTTTLAARVAFHLSNGVDPRRVLLLTFTRRAAQEMTRRVDGLLRRLRGDAVRGPGGEAVWSGTFHAIGTRLLRLHGMSIDVDPGFTIMDRGDSEDLMGAVRAQMGFARTDRRFPQKGTCMDIYSRCVNSQKPLADVLRSAFPW
jgi:DNA helicase-2/ATP-dependent DNA helicase PcrA